MADTSKKEAATLLARRDLDAQIRTWRKLAADRPPEGWVRAIRQALGMTPKQLARRAKITPSGISYAELSECDGTIQMGTLRKLAKALNCKVIYALVPDEPLETIVATRRRMIAERDLKLIGAKLSVAEMKEFAAAYAKNIHSDRLWEEANDFYSASLSSIAASPGASSVGTR